MRPRLKSVRSSVAANGNLEASSMIVIGVDVHKRTVTAVAVDEAGRMLDERTVAVGSDELVGWAAALNQERLWAVEDCRLLTPWLERQLLGLGEELVRVSPKLTVPERAPAGHAASQTRSTRSRSRGRACASRTCRGVGILLRTRVPGGRLGLVSPVGVARALFRARRTRRSLMRE